MSNLPPASSKWLWFVYLTPFDAQLRAHGLADDDRRDLELLLIADPDAGAIVRQTGGLRKIRWSPPTWARGKSGAIRVYYRHFRNHGLILVVTMHDKHDQSNLTAAQGHQIRALLVEIEAFLDRPPTRSRRR